MYCCCFILFSIWTSRRFTGCCWWFPTRFLLLLYIMIWWEDERRSVYASSLLSFCCCFDVWVQWKRKKINRSSDSATDSFFCRFSYYLPSFFLDFIPYIYIIGLETMGIALYTPPTILPYRVSQSVYTYSCKSTSINLYLYISFKAKTNRMRWSSAFRFNFFFLFLYRTVLNKNNYAFFLSFLLYIRLFLYQSCILKQCLLS